MIPERIHRIWLGSPISEEHARAWECWQRLFPEYEHVTWTERELNVLGMPRHYGSAQTYAERSDIARLRVLNEWGGIYTDCDITPVVRFDSLWTDDDRIIAFEEKRPLEDVHGMICNGLIAAAPGALDFTQSFVAWNARRHAADAAPTVRTGPFAFTAAIDYERSRDGRGIRVYPPGILDVEGVVSTSLTIAVTKAEYEDPIWRRAPDVIPGGKNVDLRFEMEFLRLRLRRRMRRRDAAHRR